MAARTTYDLIKLGYNPKTLYRYLQWLVEYGFVSMVGYEGKKYYHLTGLGAELLEVLMEGILSRVVRHLEEKGVKYRVWWGDDRVRAVKPVIYVEGEASLPMDLKELIEVIEVRVDGGAVGREEEK